MLPLVVNHYCNMSDLLHKIVLVWNDVDAIPPSVFELGEECGTELKVIQMKENKLSNRFLPRNKEEIETECEFLVRYIAGWNQPLKLTTAKLSLYVHTYIHDRSPPSKLGSKGCYAYYSR